MTILHRVLLSMSYRLVNVVYVCGNVPSYPKIDLCCKLVTVKISFPRSNSQANLPLRIYVRIESASSAVCSCRNHGWCFGWVFYTIRLATWLCDTNFVAHTFAKLDCELV